MRPYMGCPGRLAKDCKIFQVYQLHESTESFRNNCFKSFHSFKYLDTTVFASGVHLPELKTIIVRGYEVGYPHAKQRYSEWGSKSHQIVDIGNFEKNRGLGIPSHNPLIAVNGSR